MLNIFLDCECANNRAVLIRLNEIAAIMPGPGSVGTLIWLREEFSVKDDYEKVKESLVNQNNTTHYLTH